MDIIQPLGPDAIRERIVQIRAQLGQSDTPANPAEGFPPMPGLTGSISRYGTCGPMNPFGPDTGIAGKLAPADLQGKIRAAAMQNGVEPALLDALVQAESDYDPNSVSKVGAKGLTQLMPNTAQDMGVANPFDPGQNLQGGAKYLASLLKQFPDMEHAVAAYNAGPGAVMRAGGIPNYPETRAYVQRVMALYKEKKG